MTPMEQFSYEVGEAVLATAPSVLADSLTICNSILSPVEQHELEKAALLDEAEARGLL